MYKTIKIIKWGNSQGVRLTADILRDAGLKIDDQLQVTISKDNTIILKPLSGRKHYNDIEELIADYPEKSKDAGEFLWGDESPVGNEVW